MGRRVGEGWHVIYLRLMMEDRITLDQISTQAIYNLSELYESESNEDDFGDSPYSSINNTCDYYESSDIKNILNTNKNSVSLFCINNQGLCAHGMH